MNRNEALANLTAAKEQHKVRTDHLRAQIAAENELLEIAKLEYYNWCQNRARETSIPLAVRQAFFDATRWLMTDKYRPAAFMSAEALGLPYRSGHDWNKWTKGLQVSDPNPYKGRPNEEILQMLKNVAAVHNQNSA